MLYHQDGQEISRPSVGSWSAISAMAEYGNINPETAGVEFIGRHLLILMNSSSNISKTSTSGDWWIYLDLDANVQAGEGRDTTLELAIILADFFSLAPFE